MDILNIGEKRFEKFNFFTTLIHDYGNSKHHTNAVHLANRCCLSAAEDVARLRRENDELRNEISRYRRIVDGAGKISFSTECAVCSCREL